MTNPDVPNAPPIPVGFKIFAVVLGIAGLAFLFSFEPPAWYAYLNWKPGDVGAILRYFSVSGPLVLAVLLALCVFQQRSLALIPLLLASLLLLGNGPDVARHIGYSRGVAKLECWTPGTRECLLGKFERLEKLTAPLASDNLTENEQATFKVFKSTRDKFEAENPGFGKGYEAWAQEYRAALDEVFTGYPRAWDVPA